jgi:hypothetical protein
MPVGDKGAWNGKTGSGAHCAFCGIHNQLSDRRKSRKRRQHHTRTRCIADKTGHWRHLCLSRYYERTPSRHIGRFAFLTDYLMTDFTETDLADLTRHIGRCTPGSVGHGEGMAELNRRQLISAIEATEAQKEAAHAARRNANYMLASVLVAAIAAIASAVSALATVHPAWFK